MQGVSELLGLRKNNLCPLGVYGQTCLKDLDQTRSIRDKIKLYEDLGSFLYFPMVLYFHCIIIHN